MFLNKRCLTILVALCGGQIFAATQRIPLRDLAPAVLSDNLLQYVNVPSASIAGRADARELIKAALAVHYFGGDRDPRWTAADVDKASFYCMVHVVSWKDTPSDDADKPVQQVGAQNWYVYNGGTNWAQEDFTQNKRIFGAKNIALLYIHLRRTTRYTVQYDVDVSSKTPANALHLFEAASAFLPATQNAAAKDLHENIFGIADSNVAYVPSDITVTGNYSETIGQPKPIADSAVFDNEGKYYWDVSIAVPITKMSQTQFNNSNNTVTSSAADKRSVFAVLDLYPFKKDVKNTGFDWHPYALAGVGVGSQPLHKILVAAGWGPRFAQFYAGVVFARQQSLKSLAVGSPATPAQTASDLTTGFKPQFAFGINLTVRDVFKAAATNSSSPGGNSKTKAAAADKQGAK